MVATHNYDLKVTQDVGFRTMYIGWLTEHGSDQKIDLEASGDWDVRAESPKERATQLSCC